MGQYIEFIKICKSFSSVRALHNISFKAEGGQVCALLGENGAGKSTLLKIMSGALPRDSGQIIINDEEVEFSSPSHAIQCGVSMIYQERQLVPELSVMENIFMEGLPHKAFGFVDFRKAERDAQKIIDAFGMHIKPRQKVGNLSVANQQMVEIMKAVQRNSPIIAFDEPTAALTDKETKALFKVILQLKDEGKVILYVSHRLEELYEITDKMVILKDGEFVTTLQTSRTNNNELVKYMVGREIGDIYNSLDRNHRIGEVVLELKEITTKHVFDISLTLRRGEILGFAGLVGSGRSELWEAVFGISKILAGEVILNGKTVNFNNPRAAIENGIALCPEDRKEQGLILLQSVRVNITLPSLKKISKNGFINRVKECALSEKVVKDFGIKTPSIEKMVIQLSGGNQQKIILGRWMTSEPTILIMDEPTKGIDVGAKSEIYEFAYALAKQNIAIVFISSELTEVINVSDRVAVMKEGRLRAILDRDECLEDKVLSYAIVDDNIKLLKSNTLSLLVVLIIVLVFFGITRSKYLTVANAINIVYASVTAGLMAVCSTILIISGRIDLSIGANGAANGVLVAILISHAGFPWYIALLTCLILGALVGVINAVLTNVFKLQPFIATLAVASVCEGLAYLYCDGKSVPISNDAFIALGSGKLFGLIPVPIIILIVFFVAFSILLSRTTFGRNIYVIGGNQMASKLAGLNPERITTILYIISGVISSLAGCLLAARMHSGAPSSVVGSEFDGITAAVLGGVAFTGGRGTLGGCFIGLIIIQSFGNGLNFIGVSSFWQSVAKGLLLISALIVDYFRSLKVDT